MKINIVKRRIMWGDLDALGIVFYPRYYEWIDGCSHLFFDALGLNLVDLSRERSLLFGLVETSCRYFSPGRYHSKIRIETRIDRLRKKTVVFQHDIFQDDTDARMVQGAEKRICMDVNDPDSIRAVDIPRDIFTLFEEAMGSQ